MNYNEADQTGNVIFSSVKVAEWPPYGKQLLLQLPYILVVSFLFFVLIIFPFWFPGQDFGFGCDSSWPLLTFTFRENILDTTVFYLLLQISTEGLIRTWPFPAKGLELRSYKFRTM